MGPAPKPSTDLKAIELLKVYISHVHQLRSTAPAATAATAAAATSFRHHVESCPEACVVANADWCLPWLWRRRAADAPLAMAMTSAWLEAACCGAGPLSDRHPVFRLVLEYSDYAFDVFHVSFARLSFSFPS